MAAIDAYERLVALLDAEGARYRIIEHAPEGRSEIVSELRGHAARESAKCIILMVKIGKKVTRFVLAVVPGDSRVDLEAIRRRTDATSVRFAEKSLAESLAGSVSGTILPFPFDPRLELLVDPAVAASATMYFNAGRLDRSLALDTRDYLRIAQPEVVPIAVPPA
ncbi:MAG TPA: YbaK/EbsC family protein [Usitatibacter sp.]|jgi:Ala-tRNA(Pro) deacylase|nr:YbaK/EbsC family protein [Usitatibacter sp.]